MPTFRYVALDAQGNEVRGQISADSQEQVLAKMRESHLHLVDIAAGKPGRRTGRFQAVKIREKGYCTHLS